MRSTVALQLIAFVAVSKAGLRVDAGYKRGFQASGREGSPATPLAPSGTKILSTVIGAHAPAKAIAASSNTNGAAVVLDDYDGRAGALPNGNRTWVTPSIGTVGQINTFDGAQCIDVPDGDATNGNTLQVWGCATGNGNQLWTIESFGQEGKYFVRWAGAPGGARKCMQIKDQSFFNGGQVDIYDCDSADIYQSWVEGE